LICRSPRVGVPNVGTPGATGAKAAVGDESAEASGAIPLIAETKTLMNFPTSSTAEAMKLELVAPEISEHAVAVSVAEEQLFH
jgi:hypothetical protein